MKKTVSTARATPKVLRRGPSAAQKNGVRMSLRALRDAAGKTQVETAAAAHIQQSEISRLERAGLDDVMVATLRRYLAGLGAETEIVAVFPHGHRIIVVPPSS